MPSDRLMYSRMPSIRWHIVHNLELFSSCKVNEAENSGLEEIDERQTQAPVQALSGPLSCSVTEREVDRPISSDCHERSMTETTTASYWSFNLLWKAWLSFSMTFGASEFCRRSLSLKNRRLKSLMDADNGIEGATAGMLLQTDVAMTHS